MAVQNQAAVVALELEKVKNKIEPLFNSDFGLFSKIQKSTKAEKVSQRAMRLPIAVAPSGGITQVDPNSATAGFGIGTSTQYQAATFTPIYLARVMALTKEAELATASDTQAISSALKTGLKDAMTSFKVGIEQLIQGDGSGSLGSVGSISGNVITLTAGDNANSFVVQQVIQVFPTVGGVSRGSATVLAVDAITHKITLDAVPASTAADDILVVSGGSGAAGSSLYGLQYLVNGSKTGTYLGLNRADYPLQSAHVPGAGAAFTFAMSRQVLNYIRMQIGVDKSQDVLWHMPLAQSAALDAVVTEQSTAFVTAGKSIGDSTTDLLAKNMVRTLAGRPVIESTHAYSNRVDALSLESWVRSEILAPSFFEVGGQTMFPNYASDGSLGMVTQAVVWAGFQLAVQNPDAQGYADNLLVPAGY